MAEIWNGLLSILGSSLRFFYDIAQGIGFSGAVSYGLAIVLLTIAVRVLLLPLTIKQTKSMMDMQRLQPKLKAIQEKYKDDKEKLQQEMMKLYQEHKVNPFGGCLPLLLQLPVFFALFNVLNNAKLMKVIGSGAAWATLAPNVVLKGGIVQGLVAGWPFLLLLALMAITSYIPSKMMASDPQQSKTMLFMSGFLVFIAWSLPAGVLVYWITTNVISVIQQWAMMQLAGGGNSAPEAPVRNNKRKAKQVEAED
ncbi:MAG: YidC/Oxa1 family membrane protein insertase [Candidatus Aquicultorales bacterium]